MKVLYLAPQAKHEGALTAYSFLDEEIAALASTGIRAYVLGRRARVVEQRRGVVVWPLPRERSFRMRSDSMRFLMRSAAAVPAVNLWAVRQWYQAGRVERVAAELVAREKVDLVHSHFAWPGGLGGSLVRRATGVPLVACLRGADILIDADIQYGARERRVFDRNVRHLLRVADRTLYFSDFMRQAAVRLGADPERAFTVRKAVDLAHFQPIDDRAAAREALGFGRQPMILTVGSLIPRKGIDVVLEALARLRASFDFSFVVCGDGPEHEALRSLTRRLSLEDRTHFVGRVSRQEIAKYFGACDVFVLASVLEAAGNVLFEAMACGRPIVCTSAGGPAEYVEDGVTGFVVPVRDVAAIAGRVATLLAQPALQDRLGAAGRQRALTRYAYPRMVQDIVKAYEAVLDAHRRARHPAHAVVRTWRQAVARTVRGEAEAP